MNAITPIRVRTDDDRRKAAHWAMKAPHNWHIIFKEPNRTNDQNSKMWAMLADISKSEPLGRKHTPDDWKAILMNACGWDVQFLEGLDGRPFPSGFRSSHMTVKQMIDLIEYMQAFGDENGVIWKQQLQYD